MSTLADRAWPELTDQSASAVLAVPVGATEQHGPHLPLSTDTDIAIAIARGLAVRRPSVTVAPALPFGASGEHQSFAGTLSIGQQAIETVLVELVRSATETFGRVVLVSTHGGNAKPVARAVRRLVAEDREVRAWSPAACWAGDAHAGRTETSLMLALHPDRVHMERAERGESRSVRELMPAMVAAGVSAVSPNGVLGDPTGATAVEGQRLMTTAIDELSAAIRDWPAEGRVWL